MDFISGPTNILLIPPVKMPTSCRSPNGICPCRMSRKSCSMKMGPMVAPAKEVRDSSRMLSFALLSGEMMVGSLGEKWWSVS